MLIAVALTAGLVVLVSTMAGTTSRATAKVAEMEPIRLQESAHRIVGVDAEKFLLSTESANRVVNAVAPDEKPHQLRESHWYGNLVAWDETQKTLYFGDNGLLELDVTDWDNPMAKHPGSYIPGSSFARDHGVSYVGTHASQVFAVSDGRTVEQKFNGGAVTEIVAIGGSVVAYVRDRDDEEKGTLYLLDSEELTVVAEKPVGDVLRLIAVGASSFLMLDTEGLHIGSTDGKSLTTHFEIEGVKAISRDTHLGYVLLSTASATRLMRVVEGRLTTVETLERKRLVDAAFNDDVLGVIYDDDKRKIALYRITSE